MNIPPPFIVAGSLAVIAGVAIAVASKNFFSPKPSESNESYDLPAPLRPPHEYDADMDPTRRRIRLGGKRKSKRKKKSSKRV